MILFNLFLAFFRIGLFAIGGAYSFLPLIERETVEKYHWLSKGEFLDVLGMAQLFPGAISIKYATYTGYKVAGVWGAILANLGNILAPFLLVLLGSFLYTKYKNVPLVESGLGLLKLIMFAMIISVAFQLISVNQLLELKSLLIVIIAFVLFSCTKIHPALIIILGVIIGIALKNITK